MLSPATMLASLGRTAANAIIPATGQPHGLARIPAVVMGTASITKTRPAAIVIPALWLRQPVQAAMTVTTLAMAAVVAATTDLLLRKEFGNSSRTQRRGINPLAGSLEAACLYPKGESV